MAKSKRRCSFSTSESLKICHLLFVIFVSFQKLIGFERSVSPRTQGLFQDVLAQEMMAGQGGLGPAPVSLFYFLHVWYKIRNRIKHQLSLTFSLVATFQNISKLFVCKQLLDLIRY